MIVAIKIELAAEEEANLAAISRTRRTLVRLVEHAKIALLAAQEHENQEDWRD